MVLDKAARLLLITALVASAGCNSRATGHGPTASASTAVVAGAGQLGVLATTTTMAALVRTVTADRLHVDTLVPLGASPETYEPRPQDLVKVSRAALIVQNGAGLETWLAKILSSARPSGVKVLTLSDGIAHAFTASTSGYANPHFWLDPLYAQIYIKEISGALSALDPSGATGYRNNAVAERRRLQQLDGWIRTRIATVPPQRRVMITFHDAWLYFDRRYGIRDLGSIVSSPGKEPSAAEFAALIAKAKANNVHAIF